MKKLMAALTITTLLLTGCGGSGTTINQLDPTGFSNKIQESGVTVLDVRRPDEFAAGHLPNAININVESDSFKTEIAKLDKKGDYAIYCHSGRRSMIAANEMAGMGFTKLSNLSNGISSWIQAGGPIVQ